jgi:hypothetical protein
MSTLLAIGSVLPLAGCGGSSHRTPSASARNQSTLAFSECVRADGVTDFPDPGLRLSGSFNSIAGIEFPATISPSSPAFEAAQTACAKLLPGGGPGAQQPPAGFIERMREVSVCMRERGVTGFPDPTFAMPSNPAGYSMVSDEDGVVRTGDDQPRGAGLQERGQGVQLLPASPRRAVADRSLIATPLEDGLRASATASPDCSI